MPSDSSPIRVRIAPSPTGTLHIGTVRTALFNYLFAHHHQGIMVLRIEDTDRTRSESQYVHDIMEGLQILGLEWDEGPEIGGSYGPYFQSERQPLYQKALAQLLSEGKAYPCFCTEAELEAEKEKCRIEKTDYVYSGRCRHLSPEIIHEKSHQGLQPVYRIQVPHKNIEVHDLIRGNVQFHTSLFGDMIIAKADKNPLYNFAVVVDDAHMQISHVLRGEDHLSNTPKQIVLYEALGYPLPQFGHTAMMLAPDRSKLSKRHGAVGIREYLAQGFLPEALVNYLALLGWSPPDDQEIMNLTELSQKFTLERVSKSGAVFDIEKLKWVNGNWIRQLSPQQLAQRIYPFLEKAGYSPNHYAPHWLESVVTLIQEKLITLADAVDAADFLLKDELTYIPEQVDKAFQLNSTGNVLQVFLKKLNAIPEWTPTVIEEIMHQIKTELPFKPRDIMWPIRAALTGRIFGPDLNRALFLLGKEKCGQRLQQALAYTKNA